MSQKFIPVQTIISSPYQRYIASLVTHVRPAHFPKVYNWITQQSKSIHIEIHAEEPATGRLVLVIESSNDIVITKFLDELKGQAGVLNATLVYQEKLLPKDLLD